MDYENDQALQLSQTSFSLDENILETESNNLGSLSQNKILFDFENLESV